MSNRYGLALSRAFFSISACLGLLACGHIGQPRTDERDVNVQSSNASPTWVDTENWQHQTFPGKRPTEYRAQRKSGRDALSASASRSMSVMRKALRVEPKLLGSVKFSWLAHSVMPAGDVSKRELDDAPLRVVLSFEGDRSKFSKKNHMLSELALALTGEELPYATLMYVWCNKRQAGELITNPRTDRIRKIVLESGTKNLGQWLDYERDIRADFLKAFGEEPGALTGIALMTDTDNTQSTATAWYGPVSFTSLPSSKASR